MLLTTITVSVILIAGISYYAKLRKDELKELKIKFNFTSEYADQTAKRNIALEADKAALSEHILKLTNETILLKGELVDLKAAKKPVQASTQKTPPKVIKAGKKGNKTN